MYSVARKKYIAATCTCITIVLYMYVPGTCNYNNTFPPILLAMFVPTINDYTDKPGKIIVIY